MVIVNLTSVKIPQHPVPGSALVANTQLPYLDGWLIYLETWGTLRCVGGEGIFSRDHKQSLE